MRRLWRRFLAWFWILRSQKRVLALARSASLAGWTELSEGVHERIFGGIVGIKILRRNSGAWMVTASHGQPVAATYGTIDAAIQAAKSHARQHVAHALMLVSELETSAKSWRRRGEKETALCGLCVVMTEPGSSNPVQARYDAIQIALANLKATLLELDP